MYRNNLARFVIAIVKKNTNISNSHSAKGAVEAADGVASVDAAAAQVVPVVTAGVAEAPEDAVALADEGVDEDADKDDVGMVDAADDVDVADVGNNNDDASKRIHMKADSC